MKRFKDIKPGQFLAIGGFEVDIDSESIANIAGFYNDKVEPFIEHSMVTEVEDLGNSSVKLTFSINEKSAPLIFDKSKEVYIIIGDHPKSTMDVFIATDKNVLIDALKKRSTKVLKELLYPEIDFEVENIFSIN